MTIQPVSDEVLDYLDERACRACLHPIESHHYDNCIAGCCVAGCGCSRTKLTAR